jgi:hypothetical protein
MKCGQSDDAKNEYANQLQKTNKLQQTFYETALPEVCISYLVFLEDMHDSIIYGIPCNFSCVPGI